MGCAIHPRATARGTDFVPTGQAGAPATLISIWLIRLSTAGVGSRRAKTFLQVGLAAGSLNWESQNHPEPLQAIGINSADNRRGDHGARLIDLYSDSQNRGV